MKVDEILKNLNKQNENLRNGKEIIRNGKGSQWIIQDLTNNLKKL